MFSSPTIVRMFEVREMRHIARIKEVTILYRMMIGNDQRKMPPEK
jgi:hypothetical protein